MGMISSAFICFRFSFLLLLCCGHVRGANVVRTRMNRVSFERRCKDTMNKLHFANFFAKKIKKMQNYGDLATEVPSTGHREGRGL